MKRTIARAQAHPESTQEKRKLCVATDDTSRNTKTRHPIAWLNLWTVFLFIAVLTAGTLVTWWTVSSENKELRADLLQQATLLVQAQNLSRVKELTGTEADLNSPAYQRIKEQLAVVKDINPKCRFIYVLGRKALHR